MSAQASRSRESSVFSEVIRYEPGVSIGGSIPSNSLPPYQELLAAGDTRVHLRRWRAGLATRRAPLARMPLYCVKLVLRLGIRGNRWREMDSLLATHLAEHQVVAATEDSTVDRYRTITARVFLLGGGKRPSFATTELFDHLSATIPNCIAEVIDGLGHTGPDEQGPELVADRNRCHLHR